MMRTMMRTKVASRCGQNDFHMEKLEGDSGKAEDAFSKQERVVAEIWYWIGDVGVLYTKRELQHVMLKVL